MSTFRRLLSLQEYTDDDILNAENENSLYDHKKAVEAIQSSTADRVTSNDKLRGVIEASKVRSASFAEFEDLIHKEVRRVSRHL